MAPRLAAAPSTARPWLAAEVAGIEEEVFVHFVILLGFVGVFCLGLEFCALECVVACAGLGDGSRGAFLAWALELPGRGCVWLVGAAGRLVGALRGLGHRAAALLGASRCGRPPTDFQTLPASVVHDVTAYLAADSICLLGGCSRSLRDQCERLCSSELLLSEVQRLRAGQEWRLEQSRLRGLTAGSQTRMPEGATKKPCGGDGAEAGAAEAEASPSLLRQFLARVTRSRAEVARREEDARFLQVARDALRFALLCVCWSAFLCQVLEIARELPSPSLLAAVKMLAAPTLFLYVMEKAEENLLHASFAGLLSVLLILDCLLGRRQASLHSAFASNVTAFGHIAWALEGEVWRPR
eukprot:SRR837773.11046.p3 GENE.SRR837773.11046~~SRR837773.11046.p3  ORF type:complete len:374 (+),score=103.77 SRR837773.11046:63-1124(+)